MDFFKTKRLKTKIRNYLPVLRRPQYSSNFNTFLSNYSWAFSNANKSAGDYRLFQQAENNVYVHRSIEVISDTLLINGFKINNPDEEQNNYEKITN